MAENTSRLSPGKRNEFGRFKIRLANSLALRDVMTLSTYFSLTKADTDKIKRSENPGLDLVWALESEDVISPTDISELVEGLRDCNLGGVVDKIREDLPRTFSSPSISEEAAPILDEIMFIRQEDSLEQQKSIIQRLKNGSINQTSVTRLSLNKAFAKADHDEIILASGLRIPQLACIEELKIISETDGEFNEPEMMDVITFCRGCRGLKKLLFTGSLLPLSLTNLPSVVPSEQFQVVWQLMNNEYHLNFVSGTWRLISHPTSTLPVEVQQNVSKILSTEVTLRKNDRKLNLCSKLLLLENASKYKIPIPCVTLEESLTEANQNGLTLNNGFHLPVLRTMEELKIKTKRGEEFTMNCFSGVLGYLQKCNTPTKVIFTQCLLPLSIPTEHLSFTTPYIDKVRWRPSDQEFSIIPENGTWSLTAENLSDSNVNKENDLPILCSEILAMYSGTLRVHKKDSEQYQKTILKVLEIAANNRIPVSCLVLEKMLLSASLNETPVTPAVNVANLRTLEKLEVISEEERELSENDVVGVIKLVQSCHKMTKLTFSGCLLPMFFNVETLSLVHHLQSLSVWWRELDKEFCLDMSSGNWALQDSKNILRLALKNHQSLRGMCQGTTFLTKTDSKEFQRSMLLLLEIASRYRIPISDLRLEWSFRGFDGDNIRLESGLCISSLSSVEKISINGEGGNQQISEEEVTGLLNFGMKSTRFKELWFFHCKLPPSINPASLTEAMERNAKVLSSNEAKYLVMENGIWKEPEDIETIKSMCSDQLTIDNRTSESVQRSVIELLVKASNKDIPIFRVYLAWSFDKIDEDGLNVILKSGLLLPNISSIERMSIKTEKGREMKEEEVNGILNYLQQNKRLKILQFWSCVLPSLISLGPSASALKSRNVKVSWCPDVNKVEQYYRLDLGSGEFEKRGSW